MGPFQSHPYRRPMLMAKYEEDFPLRKTGKVVYTTITYASFELTLVLA
jgi:NADH:ubiquinone oxidoreductase subunit C